MSTAMNDLLKNLLDAVKPEKLVTLCSKEHIDVINNLFDTQYDEKFKEGKRILLRNDLTKILCKMGLEKDMDWRIKYIDTTVEYILNLLNKYPNEFSPLEISAYIFNNFGMHIDMYGKLLIDHLVNYLNISHLDVINLLDGNNEEDKWNYLALKMKKNVIIINCSYTDNTKIYGEYTSSPLCFFEEYYKYFKVDKFNSKFHLPTKQQRMKSFLVIRNILVQLPDVKNSIKTVTLIDSIIFDLELEWFDYAICEAIFGRFHKLYEIYVK
jgi:hypothetical protein